MKKAKEKKRSLPKKKSINQKPKGCVIWLEPEKVKHLNQQRIKLQKPRHLEEDTIEEPDDKFIRLVDEIFQTAELDEAFHEGCKITNSISQKQRGEKKRGVKTRFPGLVAAIKIFREKSKKKSIGNFIQFLSKKEYTKKTPYQIDQYDLYIDDKLIYHRDRSKKNKKEKINQRWDRPISIKSLDHYYYNYSK